MSDPVRDASTPITRRPLPDVLTTDNIFERLLRVAVEEARVPGAPLFFSALAAGLCIVLSFAGAVVVGRVTGAEVTLATAALYPVGFAAIVLGRYQLYTENTLTPVALVLTRQGTVLTVLRVWGIVLLGNLLGAVLGTLALSWTGLFHGETLTVAREVAHHATAHPPLLAFAKAVLAGWLVAGMTWTVLGTRSPLARLAIVWVFLYMVGALELVHCVAGTAEVFFAWLHGDVGMLHAVLGYLVPAIAGNTLGGVVLVGLLNYAQTHDRWFEDHEPLPWRDVLFGGVVHPTLHPDRRAEPSSSNVAPPPPD